MVFGHVAPRLSEFEDNRCEEKEASSVPYDPPYGYYFAETDDEAKSRADFFKELDPFPDLPAALLSSEHVSDYVRVTGLIHPFYPTKDRLKPASYEARAKRFIRWDDDGRKIITDVKDGDSYELSENSIVFVQIESKIRLPDYIALRFNLRIKHVHRGLLLGTGPLVDPGFGGDLLIPLHNLTSEIYVIKVDEGIIWIEFTKTSHNRQKWPPHQGEFSSFRAIRLTFRSQLTSNARTKTIRFKVRSLLR
jgi:deoxycytidine triphosphate deaminase